MPRRFLTAWSAKETGRRRGCWRDAGEIIKGNLNGREAYEKDISAIKNCSCLIAFLDGAHAGEGTAFEIGFASALGKEAVIIFDDARIFGASGTFNNMFSGCGKYKKLEDRPPLEEAMKEAE